MLMLKVNFTDEEITRFFQRNGYTVVPHMRGRWVQQYHNRNEWVEVEVPGLLVNGRIIDAAPVFQKFQEHRVRTLFLVADTEAKTIIENIVKRAV